MILPTIEEVTREIMRLHESEAAEVRLQVYEDGEWFIHIGSTCYDVDIRGKWATGYVPRLLTKESCRFVARFLLQQMRRERSKMRTMKELAQEALDIQNACNLSGVALSFYRVLAELREIARIEGWLSTDKINEHPIAVLFANKISSLTQCDDTLCFSNAYLQVQIMTGKTDV